MVQPTFRQPTAISPLRGRNSNNDQYVWDLRGAYGGIRIWDNDFALSRDPWIYEKMERDPLIRQCLWDRISTVGGRKWSIVPPDDATEEDIRAAQIIRQCVAQLRYGRFNSARINLARFFWYGATFGALSGERMAKKFGDDQAREWWVPTSIQDISKRRIRLWREGGRIRRTVERIMERDGDISHERDDFPSDRIIAAVYDDQESQLGFGRGIADACYWPFIIRWKFREEGFLAARAWAQGILHGKSDAGAVGTTLQTSSKERDDFANALRDMQARGVLVTGITEEVEILQGVGAGAQLGLDWDQVYADEMRALISGSVLPTGGGGEVGSLSRGETEAETSEGLYQNDSDLLDEIFTDNLVRPVWDRNKENLAAIGLGEARMPFFKSEAERVEDPQENRENLKTAKEIGLTLKKDEAYEILNLTVPTEEDEKEGNVIEPPDPMGGFGDPFGGGPGRPQSGNPDEPGSVGQLSEEFSRTPGGMFTRQTDGSGITPFWVSDEEIRRVLANRTRTPGGRSGKTPFRV